MTVKQNINKKYGQALKIHAMWMNFNSQRKEVISWAALLKSEERK